MKPRLAHPRLAALSALMLAAVLGSASHARAQSPDAQTLLDGLRSFALEARLELQTTNGPVTPRLFTEAVADGRTWMQYIADTLGAAAGGDPAQPGVTNQWALLDEAVSVTLAEADKMKTFAAKASTANAAKFQTARKNYLLGAARLLKFYKVAAGDVFDGNAGALPNASQLPDWLLPAEIQVKEVSGAARLNTQTGEFSGSFLGRLNFPTLGLGLEIVEASVGAGGAFSLGAAGRLEFPQPNPIGTAVVPANHPLRLSYSPAHGLGLAGEAEFTFNNGMFFRGSLGLLDPLYQFSIEAGGLQFSLVKSLGCQQAAQVPQAQTPEATLTNLSTYHGALAASLTRAAGSAAASTNDAPAETDADLETPPPEVTAWKHLVLIHTNDTSPPDIRSTLDPLLTLMETETDGLTDASDALTPSPAPAAASPQLAVASEVPVVLPKALQVDAGVSFSFHDAGPAHQDGIVPDGQFSWNVISSDRSSGLIFADGSAATGIGVDFGRSISASDPVDFNLAVSDLRKTDLFAPPLGIFQDELMADSVSTFGTLGPGGPREKLAVRVTGLPPAYYQVYAMAAPAQRGGGFKVEIGSQTSQGFNLQSFDTGIPADLELAPLWMPGITHVSGGVTLRAAGEAIVVIVNTTNNLPFAELNGLQIVAPLPVIKSFTTTATQIQQGESPELKWRCAFADQISIDPGNASLPLTGSLHVRPSQTTTYTLTARSANGVVTATITVTVKGAGRNVAGVIRKLNRVTAMTKDAVDAIKSMTKAAFRDQVDAAAMARLRRTFERQNEILEQVIDDPAASGDVATARKVAKSLINVGANSSLTGLDGIVDLSKLTTFYDRARDEFEGSLGFDPQTHAIDLTIVRAKSVDESFKAIGDIIAMTGEDSAIGSDKPLNTELVKAYLIGAREDLLDAMHFDRNAKRSVLDSVSDQQLRDIAKKLLQVQEQVPVFGSDVAAPPEAMQQLAAALQQRAVAIVNGERGASFANRLQAFRDLGSGNDLLTQASALPQHGAELAATVKSLLSDSATTAGTAHRLTADDAEIMSAAASLLGDGAVAAAFQQRLASGLRGFNLVVDTPLLPERINQGPQLVQELATLHALVKALLAAGLTPAVTSDLLPENLAPKLVTQFNALAKNKNAGKQLNEFNQAMLHVAQELQPPAPSSPIVAKRAAQNAPDPPDALRIAFLNQAVVSLGVSAQISTTLCGRLGQAPADLALPDVLIERVFGSILFNRETGFLSGKFGGSVKFPTLDARFAIREAALASDGSYSIDAAMTSPLPVGRAQLSTSLSVAGSPAGVAQFSGAGTLTVPNGNQGNRVFNVSLSYDQPRKRLGFDAQGNNLDLRLGDDFVLFDAGFGFDLSTATPNGSFRVNGSAGILAQQHPLPAVATRTNFYLVVDGLTTVFSYTTNASVIALSNGTIRLPDFFHNGLCPTNPAQPPTGPQVAIVPANPIAVTIGTGNNPTASFSGALDFRNLGFNVPGLTNLGVEVCSMRLLFRSNAVPVLTNFNATLSIPLPQQTAVIDVNGVVWRLDGFPEAGSVSLRTPLRLFDAGGVAFDFLTNTTFSFATSVDGNGQKHTKLTLAGGLQGTFDPSLLVDSQTGSAFRFSTTGSFTWETGGLPQIALGNVTFAGRMKLGGTGGFELLGVDANGIPSTNSQDLASITLTGLTNLFQLSPQRPFEIKISGALGSSDFIFFGLGDAKFRFDGSSRLPRFSIASLGFRAGTSLQLLQQQNLPFQITAGSIAFINPSLPLNQLFGPTNLRFTFSGVVDISLSPPDTSKPVGPRLFGAVDNVQVSLPNGFSGAPQFSINTFALALEGLTIGDMAGLSGGLVVGNLNNPAELFFAGEAGGEFDGVGIKAIVALKLNGLIGVCLSADLGPAGIPLDGGTLGGILLTGAEGGVSFLNQFADPCDFKSFLQLNANGTPHAAAQAVVAAPRQSATDEPQNEKAALYRDAATSAFAGPKVSELQVLSWAELDRLQKLHEQTKALRKSGAAAAYQKTIAAAESPQPLAANQSSPCPTGDCPPATLNLLCQRHPSVGEAPSAANYNGAYSNRVIFKFSSLDRKTVDGLLASAHIDLSGSSTVVAGNFANAMTNLINGLIPRPPANLPAPQRQQINDFIHASLVAMRDLVASASKAALDAAASNHRPPLDALYEAAYTGVRCVDITIQLKGTFSYLPVSVALNAQGGAVASTTGSAGILGQVNLFGLPVGTGEFFYSLTDTNGNPNPSLCGNAHLALGPLEFGGMGLAIGCDECVTGTLNALAQFVRGLTGQVLTDASPIIYAFIESAASNHVSNIRSRSLTNYFGPPGPTVLLTQNEQIAVLTSLLNLPQTAAFLNAHPNALHQFGNNAVKALADQTIQLTLNIYNSTNPRLQFCGQVEPKVFGFSLTGGNALVAADAFADKTNLRGDVTFSPSYVFGNLPFYLLSGGTINNVVPALDEATLGFSLGLPIVNSTTLHLLTTNAAQFATTQVDNLLANATLTFGYELSPFGFKLADGEGRLALPTLSDHPDNPARRAAQPTRYDVNGHYVSPTAPDRSAILKAALDSNVLAQATWSGKGADLAGLFPAGSSEAQAVAGRELVRDYFPYGGFLGAAKVQLPKPITDAPPFADLAKLFAPPTNILQQFDLAQSIFNTYVLGSREVGQFSLYVPFPRPPPAFWNAAQNPQALIDSIAQFDLNTLAEGVRTNDLSFYPVEQFFMQGSVNAQLLGLPIGQASMVADPAAGLFRLNAGVPSDSWIRKFFDANLTFAIKSADYIRNSQPNSPSATSSNLQPEVRLQAALNDLLAVASGTDAQKRAAVSNAVLRITDTLPKVSLDLNVVNFGIPRELTNILSAGASARFVAYSPRFNPAFAGTGPLADATRNGGVAFKGRFNFATYVEIENAELGVALRGAALPALSGLFDVPNLGVPGLALHNAHFAFNSDPAPGGAYIAASGSVDPISFINPLNNKPLLTIRNLTNQNANIFGDFNLTRGANNLPLPGFSLSPSRVDMSMLGPNLTVLIHGATTNDAFGFSSTAPWTNNVRVLGQMCLQDLNGSNIVCVGMVGQAFSALVRGTGMQLDELTIMLPTNITLTAFPGTPNQQLFTLGSGSADNRIHISRDGSFIVEGGIGGDMNLSGLGFGGISAGARFRLTNQRLEITVDGRLTGGAINSLASNANISSVSGQLLATLGGVSINGMATVSPMRFGVFIVSGTTGGNITAVLTNTGFFLPTGARVRIQQTGYPTNDIFTLNQFFIQGNGDFGVVASSGNINLSGFFNLTRGSYTLLRSNGVASLDIFAPTLTLFPGEPHAKAITAPFQHVFMESTGRFYADTGMRTNINLPAAFTATGRLELGFEPDSHKPDISVATNALNFGTINYGVSTNKLLAVFNSGNAPLLVTLSPSVPEAYTITPSSLSLQAGEVAQVSVRYSPDRAGPNNGTLTLLHNADSPLINLGLVATGKAVPILRLSTTNMDFGPVKRGQQVTLGLRVDNLGNTNLVLNDQRLGASQFTVTPASATVAPGDFVLLNLTFNANVIATINGTLRITSNDPAGTRDVPLTGTGFVVLWVDQRDGTETFYDIAINGTNRAIAVGPGDTVLWTTNKGHCWLTPDNATPPIGTFYGAAMTANGSTGWVAGPSGAAYQTLDGGQFWSRIASSLVTNSGNSWYHVAEVPGTGRAVFVGTFHFTVLVNGVPNPRNVLAVALQTPNGFVDGTLTPNTASSFALQSLRRVAWGSLSGQQVGLAGLRIGAGVYRTTDGGTNWNLVTIGTNLFFSGDLAMNNNGVALLVTTYGEIFRSTDAGLTWNRALVVTNTSLYAVAMDGNVAYAGGQNGVLLRSSNGGSTWAAEPIDAPTIYAIAAKSGNVWLAGEHGDIQFRPLQPPTGPVLAFDPGRLNYGFVPFNDSAPLALTLRNSGISPLTVTNIVFSGPAASEYAVVGLPVTIQPDDFAQVNVFCDPATSTNLNAAFQVRGNEPDGFQIGFLRARSASSGWVLKAPLSPTSTNETAMGVQMLTDTFGYGLTTSDLYRTSDGGASWTKLNVGAPGALRAVYFVTTNAGWIAGGNASFSLSSGNAFIRKTVNSGTSWTSQYFVSATDHPIVNISMASTNTGYAVTAKFHSLDRTTHPGEVLHTTDSGATWVAVTAPSSSFGGGALETVSTVEILVGDGAVLRRSANSGGIWAGVLNNTSFINSVFFANTQLGWVVGNDGTYWKTTVGGDTNSDWILQPAFTTNDLGRIQFATTNTGWALPTTAAPEAMIFRSDNGGTTWRNELAESPYGGPPNLKPTAIFGRSGSVAVALGTGGSVRRLEQFTNELVGIAAAQPAVHFGRSVVGHGVRTNLTLRNLGDRDLRIRRFLFDGVAGSKDGFSIRTPPEFTIPRSNKTGTNNNSVTIDLRSDNLEVGTNEVTLTIVSDGALPALDVELRSVVVAPPEVVVFQTDPPGMTLRIDGTNAAAPAAYTIADDANGPGQWDNGSAHSIEALSKATNNGHVFSFAGWDPVRDQTFNYTATNESARFTAKYIPTGEASLAGIGVSQASVATVAKVRSAFAPAAAQPGPPAGLPTGPYLRLTQASLSNSLLGNFSASGSAFLSVSNIYISLATRPVRFPSAANTPALFEVTDGSWSFSVTNNALFQLRCQTPQVTVLSNVVNPPSLLTLFFNKTNSDFSGTFSLPHGAKIAPGLLEIGPAAATLTHTSFFSLSVTGEVRALRKPDGSDWIYKLTNHITLRDGPFTNTFPLSGSLLRLTVPTTTEELFELRALSGAKFEVSRANNGTFAIALTNLAVDLLDQQAFIVNARAGTDGLFTFFAGAPPSPFKLGPFRWHAINDSYFEWNVRNGFMQFQIGGGTLTDDGTGSVPGWPAEGFTLPTLTFDSRGDFDYTASLSSFSFGGITLGQADNAEDRYLRFRRHDGVLSVKLRDRQKFFGSRMKVGFDISSNGNASGFFKGTFGVDFGAGIGYLTFAGVDLSYDSSRSSFQFVDDMRILGNDVRVKFGSGGGQVCHLYCDGNGCSETFCLGNPDDDSTGVFALSPAQTTVAAHQPLAYAFTWTVPQPRNWHFLNALLFRIRDGDDIIFWLLFNEADRTFSIIKKPDDKKGDDEFGHERMAGKKGHLKTPWVELDLEQTSVVAAGPTSPTVTLNLALNFKPKAAGHTYIIEVAASDDAGHVDGFTAAGRLTILREH